ncbi:hypothetical protein GCM10015535_17190 [Streptomyces gelaticus]|uniref:Uncharacterized protein n=1 Tax=Streptomyces gelaticus TaxID=285446 RepID=A0ABQ2VUP1_9ACTN|nr:hypothetical protein GCM10015535_17190 [Streptomyces gelaticus]
MLGDAAAAHAEPPGDRLVRLTAHDRLQDGPLQVGGDDRGAQRHPFRADRDRAGPGLVEVPDQEADQGRVLDAQGPVRVVGERDEREVPVEDDDPVGDFGERSDLGALGGHLLDVGERRTVRADRVLVDGPLPDAPPQIAQIPGQRLLQHVHVHGTAAARVGGADLLPAARDARVERLPDDGLAGEPGEGG